MNQHAAGQHLEVIRTLMERSAIYRRALAPNMLMLGVVGIAAGVAGYFLNITHSQPFAMYWLCISIGALAASYLNMRREALRDHEQFWSPPTRRVTQALAPALFVGAVFGFATAIAPGRIVVLPPSLLNVEPAWQLPPVWMLLYGCAIHAAGFFMPRGFKLFGWAYIITGALVLFSLSRLEPGASLRLAHLLMAIAFGGAHLAYGAYLAITDRTRGEA
ncbi:MAG TPA: hypothetical protein VM680_03970 [Verrucomicrobiae bacterium]|nr:hypothetical protein [Verrucomicrobiae bacterium]